MSPAVCLAFSEPGAAIADAEFNEWYNEDHIPPLTRVPSWSSWSRWVSADALGPPSHVAIYDLDSPASMQDPAALACMANPTEREKSIMSRLALLDVRVYELCAPVHPPRAGEAKAIVIVQVDVPAAVEEEFSRWYDEEHIPLLTKVPQWLRSRRYVLDHSPIYHELDENLKAKEAPRPALKKFMTIHEFQSIDAVDTEEFKATVATPWTKEIRSKMLGMERRFFTLLKSWQRER